MPNSQPTYTRRHWGKLALSAVPAWAAAKISSKLHGVQLGVAAYSYNPLPRAGMLDVIIKSMVDSGIGDCLLYAQATEPVDLTEKARPMRTLTGAGRGRGRGPVSPEQAAAIEELRKWHLTVSLDYYTAIKKKFSDAGLEIATYEPSFIAPVSDDDINRACEATKALGARVMAEAFTKSVAKRVAPISDKHGIKVAFQGRPSMNPPDPDLMSKPADLEEALSYSKNFGTSIDVGDATAAGWDALKFIEDTHARIFSLNLKDRTKAGASVPWGQGDAHIKEILQMIRDKKYPIRCYIDCDYPTAEGGSRISDVKTCFEFAKGALA